jgi:hypothetical protein
VCSAKGWWQQALSHGFVEGGLNELTLGELGQVELDQQQRLAALAYGDLSRDEAVVAFAIVAENGFHRFGRRTSLGDDSIDAVLQHIISRYPDSARRDRAGSRAIYRAMRWWQSGIESAPVLDAIAQVKVGLTRAFRAPGGRIVFAPAAPIETAFRAHWFDVLRLRRRALQGETIVPERRQFRALVERLDLHCIRELRRYGDRCDPPGSDTICGQECSKIAVQALQMQFAGVADDERWGGLDRAQQMAALLPLYERATARLFVHSRAFRFVASDAILTSAIEVLSLDEMADHLACTGALDAPAARDFYESLLWNGNAGRRAASHPLIPARDGRALLLPSRVLFQNWLATRELAAAQSIQGTNELATARDRRYARRAEDILFKCGFRFIEAGVLVKRANGSRLTDLDVVAVEPGHAGVLVLQLKAFLLPRDVNELRRANDNVVDAIRQCRRADDDREATRRAIEARFHISLPSSWTLRQLIVVEATPGTEGLPSEYPVVSLDWLSTQSDRDMLPSVATLWKAAMELPDAEEYMASIRPAFGLIGDGPPRQGAPLRSAVFQHAAEPLFTRDGPDEV